MEGRCAGVETSPSPFSATSPPRDRSRWSSLEADRGLVDAAAPK